MKTALTAAAFIICILPLLPIVLLGWLALELAFRLTNV